MSLTIGQMAPEIKLPDPDKKFHSLADYKGKNVVLFFFPGAWTGTCTQEMCNIQENFSTYASLNAVPIGISVDSIFALKKFKEDQKLNDLTLLSDYKKEAIAAYDIIGNNFSIGYDGVAKRATFVIDKEGILRFEEVLPAYGDFPNMEAIKNAVKALN